MKKVYIIAEAGVNHNGDFILAKEMIHIAKHSGADAIKFQTAVPELVMTKHAQKANYQKELTGNDESQLEMAKKIHLQLSDYKNLKQECDRVGIEFLSTPFDFPSIHTLSKLNMTYWKVPSGEITNIPYLREIAKYASKVILSTGMSTLQEIKFAVNTLIQSNIRKENIIILHCTTDYPTKYTDVNLNAMLSIKKELDMKVGYSDHTIGNEVSLAAVSIGAEVIEKHFTLDKTLEGPDHTASLDPEELYQLVQSIRNLEQAFGSSTKQMTKSEEKNINLIRRSIVAKYHIPKGEVLTEENMICKRPADGISPIHWDSVIGTKAIKDFNEDDFIEI